MYRLVLLLLTSALLLVAPRARAAKPDIAGALAYVPSDSFAVVTADLEKVKRSTLFAMVKQAFLAEEKEAKRGLDKLKKSTGFDLWRDAHAVVVAFGKDFTKDDDQFAAIIQAEMDEARVVDFVKKEGDEIEKTQSAQGPYYLLGRRKEGALAFRGQYVILAGAKMMPDVLKRQGLGLKVKQLLAPHKSRGVAFAVDVTPAIAKELARKDKTFADAKSFAGGLDLTSGADLRIEAGFSNAQAPRKLAQVANQGLAEARSDKQAQKMGLDQFLSKIQVRAFGTKLRADAKLSNGDLKKLDQILRGLLF